MTITPQTTLAATQLFEIRERLRDMRRKETSAHYKIPDYLTPEWQARLIEEAAKGSIIDLPNPNAGMSQLNLWREKICEWCYQVVDHFDYSREVVNVAMSYLDRYIAKRTVNRRIFQLAAMTALYLASKLFEPGKLHISSLVGISRGYFLAEHIVTMEHSMLQALSWHVHPPIPSAFCSDLTKLISSADVTPRLRHDLGELAKFLTEISVCDYYFVTRKPSSIATAAIINAIELTQIEPKHKIDFLHNIVSIGLDIADDDEIIECYERLREMYILGGYTHMSEDEDNVPPSTANTKKRKRDGSETIRSA